MSDYSKSKQESVDTKTEKGCVLTILAKHWIMICFYFLTIALCALAFYKGVLIRCGWLVGGIWATISLCLVALLGESYDTNRRLWKLINKHEEYERLLEGHIKESRKLLSEVVNGRKSQTV